MCSFFIMIRRAINFSVNGLEFVSFRVWLMGPVPSFYMSD